MTFILSLSFPNGPKFNRCLTATVDAIVAALQ